MVHWQPQGPVRASAPTLRAVVHWQSQEPALVWAAALVQAAGAAVH
jgi:hypothetical protein